MNRAPDNAKFRFSQRVYERLLLAYPRIHRVEYGAAMSQLFRDQCRDAWDDSGNWGLCKLWLRILPDLINTSILERISALKKKKSMSEKLANLSGFRVSPASTFVGVFITVFLLVFGASVAITFILPKVYASTARIKVEPDAPAVNGQSAAYDPYFIQTTFEDIQSEPVLKPAIDKLNLNVEWGKKYYNGDLLKPAETIAILKQRLQLEPVRNTRLIAITAYSDDKSEAAQIANAVAESYVNYRMLSRDQQERRAVAALQEMYDEQAAQMQATQVKMSALQTQYGIPDNVEAVESSLLSTRKALLEGQSQLARLEKLDPEQKRQLLAATTQDTAFAGLLTELRDAEQKYATLTNDYALSNVTVTRVASLIEVLNQQINDRQTGLMAGLESRVDASKVAADDLAAAVQRSKPAPETEPYWTAKRSLEQLTEAHKALSAKIEDQKLAARIPRPALAQIVDTARPGMAPIKPNKMLNLALGAVLGIFLASAAGSAFALWSFASGRRARKTAIACAS